MPTNYYFSQDQINAINEIFLNPVTNNAYTDRYDAILSIIQQPDVFGSTADASVVAWFGAAAQANRGVGGASDFIRIYTAAQIFIRTGEPASSTDIQAASDAINQAVWNDLLNNEIPINGQTYYALPTVLEIGRNDALATMGTLGFSTTAIWSGNLLYLGFGITEFYEQNIIGSTENTYDFFAMREAMVAAGFSEAMFDGGIQDLWDLFWGQGWSGVSSAISAIGSAKAVTNAWLQSAYGDFYSQVLGGVTNFTAMNFWTGSANGEQVSPYYSNVLTDPDNLHGGGGNDDLYGTLGLDLIDGGQGYDTANFATEPISLRESTVELRPYVSDVPYSATVTFLTEDGSGTAGISNLYDVEKLVLGEHSDLVIVTGDTHLQFIDGSGGNAEGREIAIQGYSGMAVDSFRSYGDTLQLEGLDTGTASELRVRLHSTETTGEEPGYLSTGTFTLVLQNFEDVVGTGIRDVISGSQFSNYLFGMSGDDLLVGEGATDFLDGGDGNDVLYGGTWAGLDHGGPGVDPTDYEDDGVKDYLVGGLGVEKYYASSFDEITDATIHAVDEAAAAGTRFVADGDGEVYFDGRLLDGGVRIPYLFWNFFPPTPSLNIALASQVALFIDMDAENGPLYYRVMNAYTYATDGTRVDEWLLIVEDPNAGTAITITGANFTPGAGIGEGFLGLGGAALQADMVSLMSADASALEAQSEVAVMDADVFVESLGSVGQNRANQPSDLEANLGLGKALENVALGVSGNPGQGGNGSAAAGSQPNFAIIGNGRPGEVFDLSEQEQDAVSATLPVTAFSSGSGFLGIITSEPLPIPDTTGNDLIRGTNSSETLTATEGNDTLKGSGGNDTLNGGWGADVLDGGSGTDTATFVSSNAGVQVFLYAGSATGGHAQGDTLTSIENVIGSGYADSLYGTTGSNILIGNAGNDYFEGRGGTDRFEGGLGNDAVGFAYNTTSYITVNLANATFGGLAAGNTYISIESFGGTNNTAQGDTMVGNDGRNDLYGYAGNDVISGAGGNDLLNGGDGADTIDGGVGDDLIQGATGADRLTGGAGFDVFRFALYESGNSATTWDTVTDFNQVDDFLQISTTAGFRWIGTDAFETGLTGGLPYDLRYQVIGGATHVMADINRDGIADQVIVLNGVYALDASDFSNTIVQIKSSDPVLGTAGDDLINGTAYGDRIDGLAGNDTINGLGNGDSISGGDGNDRLLGNDGNDTIHGGLGLDTIIGGEATGDYSGMDVLYGGADRDTVYGMAYADTLFGGDDRDYLRGGLNNDVLYGGTGNDGLYGESGNDLLLGEEGDDYLEGDSSSMEVEGAYYYATRGSDTLYGGAGNDHLVGDIAVIRQDTSGPGNDVLYGGDGDDTLGGWLGTDFLDGGAGNDILELSSLTADTTPGSGAVVVDLVAQTYRRADNTVHSYISIEGVITTSGNDVVYGDSQDNRIETGDGRDTVWGGAGNDMVIDRDLVVDEYHGGAGIDTIDMSRPVNNGTYDLALGLVTYSNAVTEIVEGFENLIAGGGNDIVLGTSGANMLDGSEGNDTVYGGDGDDQLFGNNVSGNLYNELDNLFGGAGNDTLYGGAESDTLDGGIGNDSMVGGAGNDTYIVESAGDVVVEAAAGGTDLVQSSVTFALAAEVENLTLMGSAAINGSGNVLGNTLTGNTGANLLQGLLGNDNIYGGAADDRLEGGDGNDLLDGGAGNDSLEGGGGDDTYVIDAAGDIVTEVAGGGTDLVQSGVAFTLGTGVENLTLTGSLGIAGTGNELANILTGNTGANTLTGLDGHDSLYGGGANDTLSGGVGNDVLDGGSGSDSLIGGLGDDSYVVDATTDALVEATGEGTDSVTSSVSLTLAVNVENLTLSGTSGLSGTGNALDNRLSGNSGANSLSGLDGNDTLLGGAGNDALTGGLGADHFVFSSTTGGVDVISDFNQLDGGADEFDVLRFEGLGVGTFAYLGTGDFTGGSDNSEARVVGNQILMDANGDGMADITITLTGLTSASQLGADDFLFV